jgi:hypothetical protein
MPLSGIVRRAMTGIAGAVALVVAILLGVTACSSTPPKPDFITGFHAAESDYRTQIGALQKQAPSLLGQGTSTQLTLFDGMSKTTGKAVAALKKLTPPARTAALYRNLLASLSAQQDLLGRIQTAARTNDAATLNESLSGFATDLPTGISLLHQIDDALVPTARTS